MRVWGWTGVVLIIVAGSASAEKVLDEHKTEYRLSDPTDHASLLERLEADYQNSRLSKLADHQQIKNAHAAARIAIGLGEFVVVSKREKLPTNYKVYEPGEFGQPPVAEIQFTRGNHCEELSVYTNVGGGSIALQYPAWRKTWRPQHSVDLVAKGAHPFFLKHLKPPSSSKRACRVSDLMPRPTARPEILQSGIPIKK